MKDYEKKFIGFLKTNNLKYTRPRQVILQAAFKNKSHFDVETLYEQIRRKSRDVSRATVYRTMPLLVKSGLIKQSLRCQAKDQYENVSGLRSMESSFPIIALLDIGFFPDLLHPQYLLQGRVYPLK